MFERFTQQAREVVIHAQDEARDLDHPYIGTEHLLLALLNPDAGIAHTVLHAAGLNRTGARADVKRLLHKGSAVLGDGDAEALQEIGIDLDAVRARIEETFGPGALAGTVLGRKCPDFEYKTTDGKTVTRETFKDKAFLLDIWSVT